MNAGSLQSLWCEVLLLTIADAFLGVRQVRATKEVRAAMTRRARDYLTKPNRDFDTVCNFAGIDPDAARERLRIAIGKSPSPEELAEYSLSLPNAARRQKGERRKRRPKDERHLRVIT